MIAVLMLVGIAAQEPITSAEVARGLEQADTVRSALDERLRDYGEPEFRDVHITVNTAVRAGRNPYFCGWVNIRNATVGHSDWREFAAAGIGGDGIVFIRDSGPPVLDETTDIAVDGMCGPSGSRDEIDRSDLIRPR